MSRLDRSRSETRSQLVIAGILIGIALIAGVSYFTFMGAFPH